MRNKFKPRGEHYAYILECSDGTYYTGYTNNLQSRVQENNQGKRGAKYTRGKRPVRLVWCNEYKQFKAAFIMEKRIKTLTRLQKESLVNGKRLDRVLLDAGK